ncbi:MFS transporter, DHA2 family, multidrug resistance protein [Aureimonas altamirensis DSM 21988]|uniref:Major facilitator superfamily transporter n=2 Tax=Aureimonas altamirensis TaxID=370622 RepID=A0A0P0YX91_9HYPH|nr:MFS transporter [Aureimonas altamirensis]BAT26104.1 major facilitator superfamily transporter [Aureimonas altamirensis]SHJ37673.1 MFS transporter, DHA2 family, multidrug resistance protein [Aureimonas altamirensis DSM 21988]
MATGNRWLVLAIVSSALFLIVVDMTVLYTALPRLTHDLAASASQKLWIVNAYPLVVAGLLPGLGTLGDRLGHRRLFLSGLIVFGIASLCAAYSPTPEALIAARALLAVGAAMMMPATLSIIRLTFTDDDERSFAIGIWAAVASGGAAFGPVIGGVMLEYFWWGSVFLINVPVVAVAFVLGYLMVPARRGDSSRKWDIVASAQIMVALIALAFAIKEAGRREATWEAVVAGAVVGVVAMALFVRRQRRSPAPLIDFSLFRIPRFSAGVATAMATAAALVGIELILSQRLQLVLGYSPLQAGLLILPIPAAAFIAGPLAGLALPKLGADRTLWLSLGVAGLGLALYIFSFGGAASIWLGALAVMGFGIGAAMTAASSTIMMSAPESRAGMAASVEEVSYELGGAIGVAMIGSLMSLVYTASLALPQGLTGDMTVMDSLDEALIAAELLPAGEAEILAALARSAFDNAYLAVAAMVTFLLLATALGVWAMTRNQAASRTTTT